MSILGNYVIRCFPRRSSGTLSSTFFSHTFKTSSKIHVNCFSYSVTSQSIDSKSCAFLNKRNKCTNWTPVCKLHHSAFTKSSSYKLLDFTSASACHFIHGYRNWSSSSFNKRRGRRKGMTFKRKDGGKTELGSKYKPLVKKERFENYGPANQFDGMEDDYGDVETGHLPLVGGERVLPYKLHKGSYALAVQDNLQHSYPLILIGVQIDDVVYIFI